MLDGKNVRLRAVEPTDVDVLFRWENDFELWKVSGTLKPFSRNLLEQYVNSEELDIYQSKQLRLMIEAISLNETIGMIDLFEFDTYHSRAGVGIMIHKSFRSKGYAFEALNILCDYTFKYLGIHQLYCDISESNTDSLKLFAKAGFEKICIKKEWIFNGEEFENVIFFQKINSK